MARGKVQMKKIENPVHRQVTFCKRRAGLLKKAKELSVLCDAEIGVLIFSAHGKLFELATPGTMQGLMEKYKKANDSRGNQSQVVPKPEQPQEQKEEINKLKQEIEVLQKGLRFMAGGGAETALTLDELNVLERYLEIWMYNIRSTKMDIMFKEIQSLKNKEEILKEANYYLQEKMDEQYMTGDMAPMLTSSLQYPLTLQNEIFQF